MAFFSVKVLKKYLGSKEEEKSLGVFAKQPTVHS